MLMSGREWSAERMKMQDGKMREKRHQVAGANFCKALPARKASGGMAKQAVTNGLQPVSEPARLREIGSRMIQSTSGIPASRLET